MGVFNFRCSRLINIRKVAYYSAPNLTGISDTFVDSKYLFKLSNRSYILFATILTGYQITNIFVLRFKKTLIYYFHLVAWRIKSVDTTKNLLEILHHLLLEISVQYLLVTRDYKPSEVRKLFSNASNISKEDTRNPKNSNNFSTLCNFISNITH